MGRLEAESAKWENEPLLTSTHNSVNASDDFHDGTSKEEPTAGFWACVFNLSNAAIGAGILTFPYAFQRAGYGMGIALTFLFASVMGYTLVIIATCSEKAMQLAREGKAAVKSGSYQEIVSAILGRNAGITLNVMLFTFLTLANISFLIIMFDQLDIVLKSQDVSPKLLKRMILVPIIGAAIGYPLANVPSMAWYAIPSTCAQFGVFFTVGVVCYYGFTNSEEHQKSPEYHAPIKVYDSSPLLLIESVPLIAFSFQCHVTCALVYRSLKNRSVKRMTQVIVTCFSICVALFIPIAVGGYYMLGDATPSDILTGFCAEGQYFSPSTGSNGCCVEPDSSGAITGCAKPHIRTVVVIARVCMFMCVSCSYGIITFVCRTCICDFVMGPGKDFSRMGYHIATVTYVAATIVVAIFVEDLSIPAEFSGIIIVVICIFFPGVLKMKCADTASDRYIGITLMVFAVICTGVCLFCAIHNIISRS